MGVMASQITSLMIVYSTVYSDTDQRKHQSSALLVFVREIYRGAGEFPAQMASNVENVSISWHHHGLVACLVSDQILYKNNFGENFATGCTRTVWYKTNFGSQNFGLQIWFCTRLQKLSQWCSHWEKFHQNDDISISVNTYSAKVAHFIQGPIVYYFSSHSVSSPCLLLTSWLMPQRSYISSIQ